MQANILPVGSLLLVSCSKPVSCCSDCCNQIWKSQKAYGCQEAWNQISPF